MWPPVPRVQLRGCPSENARTICQDEFREHGGAPYPPCRPCVWPFAFAFREYWETAAETVRSRRSKRAASRAARTLVPTKANAVRNVRGHGHATSRHDERNTAPGVRRGRVPYVNQPTAHGFTLVHGVADSGSATIRVRGRLEFLEAAALWSEATALLLSATAPRVDFDLSEVEAVDGAAMALLVHLRNRLRTKGIESEFVGAARRVQDIVHLYEGDLHSRPRRRRKPESTLAQIGRATIAVVVEAQLVFAFFGQMLVSAAGTLRAPRTGNWGDSGRRSSGSAPTRCPSWSSSTFSSDSSWLSRAPCN